MARPTESEVRELGQAHLGRLLLQALRAVEAGSVQRLRERGHDLVRTGHIPVFSQLGGGPLRITDLAGRAGMTRQMMGRLVRELQDAGYVRTDADPVDQRAIIVALTDHGWQFCHDAQDVMRELEHEYDDLLGPGGLARLRQALTTLAGS
jgi:DNA-binding MarR family transcriptional regulator